MYGSEITDQVVRYYDQAFGISGEDELAWYLGQARAAGGPVLDLACGTGRLALLLAREGFQVTGIDQSKGMLEQFKKKLSAETDDIRRRIHFANQSMADFCLPGKFNTILCCDAFFHNLTVEAEIKCLKSVARHLNPEGRFVFNLPNPTCDFIQKIAEPADPVFEERGRYPLGGNNGTLLVEQASSGSMQDQVVTTTLRFTRFDQGGKIVETGESRWKARYLFKYEAVHLLHRCGFEVEALVGAYDGSPVSEAGQLIFTVKLRE